MFDWYSLGLATRPVASSGRALSSAFTRARSSATMAVRRLSIAVRDGMTVRRFLTGTESLNRDLAARPDTDVQLIAAEKLHTHEGICVGLVHEDAAHFAVPDDPGPVDVKQAFAAVGQDAAT